MQEMIKHIISLGDRNIHVNSPFNHWLSNGNQLLMYPVQGIRTLKSPLNINNTTVTQVRETNATHSHTSTSNYHHSVQ